MLEVNNDVFEISNRVKEIDPDYYIVYNKTLRRFEVHHRRQHDTLALAVPYRSLDARTITLTLKTRRENIEKLMKEMDEENKRREVCADKKILDSARGRLEEELSSCSLRRS